MNDIAAFKLLNGDDVVTKYSKTETEYKFYNPLQLVISQGPGGKPQPALVPWVAYADPSWAEKDGFVVQKSLVIAAEVQPVAELMNAYQKMTGKIITPPTKSLIINP